MESALRVRFWGTRGSGPAPFPDRMRYGGNTSCVTVRFTGGLVVFEAGTGILALGRRLEEACQQGEWSPSVPVHLFIGHLHLDHIQGLSLFSWLFQKGAVIHLYGFGGGGGPASGDGSADGDGSVGGDGPASGDGSAGRGDSFRRRLSAVCGPPYWPVAIGQVPAALTWHEIGPGETIQVSEGVRIRTEKAEHPNGGLLYRVESGSQSVVYGLDCELGEADSQGSPVWERYREFAKECSLLIFDAPYTEEEYRAVRGYGHSFLQQGIRMAKECHAARVCISHHEWGRTDEQMEVLERFLKELGAGSGVKAEFAREGVCIQLPGMP